MARPLRLELPGASFHVYARGDNRQAIFRDNADRELFLTSLFEVARRLRWRLWAYCLMPNHYHLLVETPDANLSRGMRDVNGGHSQRFNRRHRRVGHVFQGRFKATLVDRDSYQLELIRYIVNNPVRSGLCKQPGDWAWSSHRDVMGWRDPVDPSVQTTSTLNLFAPDLDVARRLYARFVFQGVNAPSPLAAARHQIFLGDETFVQRSTRGVPAPSTEVPRAQRAWQSLQAFQDMHSSRNGAIAAAYRAGTHPVSAIARHFGLHPSTVGRIAREGTTQQAGRIPRRRASRRSGAGRSRFKT